MAQTPLALAQACSIADEGYVIVTILSAKGSTPRDADASMVVSAREVAGTIGGGRLEWDAIAAARAQLTAGKREQQLAVPLGPEIGQCCGGHVALLLRLGDAATLKELQAADAFSEQIRPLVMIYGAGHVGRALAQALLPLPFKVQLIESREAELRRFDSAGVDCILTEHPVRMAEEAPAHAGHVIMTHSHAEDSLIAAALLERGDFAYLGLIGSATKKALFMRAFRELEIPEDRIKRVICPIGGDRLRDKRPEVIAALTAAEIATELLGKRNGG